MNRAFTRLKTVYCTFDKIPYVWKQTAADPTVVPEMTTTVASDIPLKECNFFYHPQYVYQGGDNTTRVVPWTINHQSNVEPFKSQQGFVFQHNTEVEAQLQIGSKLIPEMPIRSSAEAYYALRKALGSHGPGSIYSVNIPDREFRTNKFILAFDCERQTNTGFSGLNTRTGDLITIKLLNLTHRDNEGRDWGRPTYADFLHTALEYDAIMTISDAGVQVLE
jgi:hypothetical protein